MVQTITTIFWCQEWVKNVLEEFCFKI